MSFLTLLLLSILLGLIPEALFFALFVIGAKKMTRAEGCIPLVLLFIFAFVTLGTVLSYSIWVYVVLTVIMYLIMKAVSNKVEFIDLFLLTVPYIILAILGFIGYGVGQFIPSSLCPPFFMLIVNRILLFITLSALYPHLHKWYNFYKKVWNAHAGNKIKSITVRNISILACNTVILAAYTVLKLIGR